MTPQQFNQQLVMHDPLVSEIHDRLLDDNKLSLADAYNQACAEIGELYLQLQRLQVSASAGFTRQKPEND
jgi:hypothetical protein